MIPAEEGTTPEAIPEEIPAEGTTPEVTREAIPEEATIPEEETIPEVTPETIPAEGGMTRTRRIPIIPEAETATGITAEAAETRTPIPENDRHPEGGARRSSFFEFCPMFHNSEHAPRGLGPQG